MRRYTLRPDGLPCTIPHNNVSGFSVMVAGSQVDGFFFVADADYEVDSVRECHSVAGAASSTLDIKKCTGTQAPASGTSVLTSTFALDSTANTVVTKNAASGLSITQATVRLAAGDRLAMDWTGTVSAYVGTVTCFVKRVQGPTTNL